MKLRNLLSTLAMSLIASAAHAQWTVTNLNPLGATESGGFAASEAFQGGYAIVGGVRRAALWIRAAAPWMDLNPAGSTSSYIYGAECSTQVGEATVGGVTRASLWFGTAGSWVNLSPAAATSGAAYRVSGPAQAGEVTIAGVRRASLWYGSSASRVDLHPAGAAESHAHSVFGTTQVGAAIVGGIMRASMWTGSAASWVDLSPAGATFSAINDLTRDYQAGEATVGGVKRASIWFGTAASWTDLNPAGSTESMILGASDEAQAGLAWVGGIQRASFWTGTAGSWVDLHALLPAGFTWSTARSVSTDGFNEYVVGYGFNAISGRTEALLWSRPIPRTLTIQSQSPASGVPITVWTPDIQGLKNGVTTFQRVYRAWTVASMTAPLAVGNQWFDRWELDGQNATVNRTVSVTMNENHTVKAVYVTGRTLTVNSLNPASGVPITVYRVDKQGLKNGTTQFTRIYGDGSTVSLTAPGTAGAATFVRWLKDGAAQPVGMKTISVSLIANLSVTAVYAP